MKSLVDDYEWSQDFMSEARDQIPKGFKDMKENQYVFAAINWMIDVDRSDILNINEGGVMMSVTTDTLTQIKVTSLEALFSRQRGKRLAMGGNSRVFLDVNPKCFGAVVDYLNYCNIMPTDCSLDMSQLGK